MQKKETNPEEFAPKPERRTTQLTRYFYHIQQNNASAEILENLRGLSCAVVMVGGAE